MSDSDSDAVDVGDVVSDREEEEKVGAGRVTASMSTSLLRQD